MDHFNKSMDRFDKFIETSGMDSKNYQRDGVAWLLENELKNDPPFGVRGGFVADEMGLGKTIMMIGLCIANFKFKTLIVVPPVLLNQWHSQIYKTTGHKSIMYHGRNKHKLASYHNLFEKSVIVLCSYDAISKKIPKKKKIIIEDDENNILHKIKWGRVIFDEAHHLRNKNTGRYFGAKLLQSDIKWLVSGTPIQNKKQDFYALCSLIKLPASYFKQTDNYSDIVSNFILKRTKKMVGIDLMEAQDNKTVVSWKNTSEEMLARDIHSALIFNNTKKQQNNQLIENILEKGINQLPLLLRARQACIYPKMMQKLIQNFKNMGLIKDKDKDNCYDEAMNYSSKLDAVVEAILLRKDNGNGKIVFCHFKEEMNIIAERLKNYAGENFTIAIIDGKTSVSARKKILVDPKNVLIMQIQTGCEGLNLQEHYNEVYFVSPHWNPYVEDQAIARCHRIGQIKPVFVWRFEMDKFIDMESSKTISIEQYVNDVQKGKRDLVSQIIE